MRVGLTLLILMLCAACQPLAKQPSLAYRYLDLVSDEHFDAARDWPTYDAGDELRMWIDGDAYRMRLTRRQFVWTQTPARHSDVVIEANLKRLSGSDAGYAGVACRLDPGNSGRGYYFLISGDGYYSLRWSNGRRLDDIIGARFSDAIQRDGGNRLRAVCIGEYLALWINDVFVAEARDHRASEGTIGLAAALNRDGESFELAFDWLKTWRAADASVEA